jgi:hypothetical protein
MRITNEVIKEAQDWVKAINKHFRIKREIAVRRGRSKLYEYAVTSIVDDNSPVVIELLPDKRHKHSDLFLIMYHEMIHILLWPLTKPNPIDGPLDKKEEQIVRSLERLMAKVMVK